MKHVNVTSKFNNVQNTYESYSAILSQANRTELKLCGNTTVNRENDMIVIRLHGHAIIYYTHNGFVFLDDCGYQTVTTKQRMNQFSPVSVHQSFYEWYYNDVKEFTTYGSIVGYHVNSDTIFEANKRQVIQGDYSVTMYWVRATDSFGYDGSNRIYVNVMACYTIEQARKIEQLWDSWSTTSHVNIRETKPVYSSNTHNVKYMYIANEFPSKL